MDRYVLSDAQWAKMQPHCLGKKSDPGRSGEDNRRFVEAVLWIARTGSPWRDLPPLFGPWNTVFKRYAMVDATIGKSKGGMTTKILAPHRCPGQPRPIRPAAGTALRYHRRSAAHRGDRIRRADRRQGLRQQRHHR